MMSNNESAVFLGYRRSHPMTEELSALVVAALREHPTQRLGQLLCNATHADMTALFNLHDENLAAGLRSILSEDPDVWGCEYAEVGRGGCALAATVDSPPPTSVQLKDMIFELEEKRQELSRIYARARRAETVIQTVREWVADPVEAAEGLAKAVAEYDAA